MALPTYLTRCTSCGKPTSKVYARAHSGMCKACHADTGESPVLNPSNKVASRDEQYARYLDCGPLNWDDKDGGGY